MADISGQGLTKIVSSLPPQDLLIVPTLLRGNASYDAPASPHPRKPSGRRSL